MLKKVSLSSLIALPSLGLPALLAAALTTLAPLTAYAQDLFLTGGSYTASNATYQNGSIYAGMDSGLSTTNSRGIPYVANLSVVSGGAVGTANAYNSSTVNISGSGSVATANGYNFSIVTVSGGRVGDVYGYGTSTLNFRGGVVDAAYGNNTSYVDISGGNVRRAFGNNTSTVNISGNGTVSQAYGYDTSAVDISGGRVDFAYGYDTSIVNISGGSIGSAIGYDTSTVNISGGRGNAALGFNTSTINVTGGIFNEVRGGDTSTVNISDGSVGIARGLNFATVNITGGSINAALGADTSTVNISGGSVNELYGTGTSILNISGGTLTNGVFLYDTTAAANFVGTDLSFAYQSYGNSNPYNFFADFFKVSGTIGGAPVTYDLYIRNDINSTGTDTGVPTDSEAATENRTARGFLFNGAAVTVVPEANTFALALPALGMIGAVMIRCRKGA